MSEKINCPFCGNLIDVNAIKCPNCNALFKEPELPNIKFKELGPFIAIDLLTFGFFSTIFNAFISITVLDIHCTFI